MAVSGCHDIQYDDTQHNDIQHRNKEIVTLYTEFHYAECHK
jgi:hypothetical protein